MLVLTVLSSVVCCIHFNSFPFLQEFRTEEGTAQDSRTHCALRDSRFLSLVSFESVGIKE
jgi:hypothetical protein